MNMSVPWEESGASGLLDVIRGRGKGSSSQPYFTLPDLLSSSRAMSERTFDFLWKSPTINGSMIVNVASRLPSLKKNSRYSFPLSRNIRKLSLLVAICFYSKTIRSNSTTHVTRIILKTYVR